MDGSEMFPGGSVPQFAMVAALAGVGEELLFRGVLQTSWENGRRHLLDCAGQFHFRPGPRPVSNVLCFRRCRRRFLVGWHCITTIWSPRWLRTECMTFWRLYTFRETP